MMKYGDDFQPSALWHVEIRDHHLNGGPAQDIHPLGRIGGEHHGMPGALQHRLQQPADRGVVLDHKNRSHAVENIDTRRVMGLGIPLERGPALIKRNLGFPL